MKHSDISRVLWSVRMRSSISDGGLQRHISGAERLVSDSDLSDTILAVLNRARHRTPESITISVDQVGIEDTARIPCIPISTVGDDFDKFALSNKLLEEAGVLPSVACSAFRALHDGLGADGTPMRGASLWDQATGERLEQDHSRGVRASRFDYSVEGAAEIDSALRTAGLIHFRTREAVAVATKTLWAGVTAEICWSDEPDYHTGYIATRRAGYVRIPQFKPPGAVGGRVFFVDRNTKSIDIVINRLEREAVLIDPPVNISEYRDQ